MPKGTNYTQEFIFKIINLYESGMNCGEIASEFGLHRNSIRLALVGAGVKIKYSSPQGKATIKKDVTKWKKDYESGMNLGQVAQKYGVVKSTVLKHLKRNGVKMRENKKRNILSEEQELQVVKEYEEGYSITDCSRMFPVCANTIHQILKRHNIETSKGRRIKFRRTWEQKKILKLYADGWSLSGVADEFDCSRDAVMAVLKIHGVKIKSYGELNGFVFKDRKGREFHMRSTWEMKYAQHLDKKGIKWDYEKESFVCKNCTYTPDFWVYNSKGELEKLVEIKGYYSAESKSRIKTFRLEHKDMKLKLLFEKNLKKMGIIK